MTATNPLITHPFAAGFGDDQLDALAACATGERYEAGRQIFREGADADACHLIRTGLVELQLHTPDGPLVIETLTDGGTLGWSWLLPPHRWRFDAVAAEPVEAIRLDAERLRVRMDDDPRLGVAVAQRLLAMVTERLEHTRVRLMDVYGQRHVRA